MMVSVNLVPVGRAAVLVEVASAADAVSLAEWCRTREAARDVVPGAQTVLLDGVREPDVLPGLLAGWRPSAAEPGPLVEVPVTLDGPDVADVASWWRCTAGEVGERLASVELMSAFCGFAPGFAYLTGLEPALHRPRLATPRTAVPAGAVGIAGEYTGVYPRSSPGGWRLLGRTAATLWDLDRTPPALLVPGVRVRFRPL